jgi:hypothetical protein
MVSAIISLLSSLQNLTAAHPLLLDQRKLNAALPLITDAHCNLRTIFTTTQTSMLSSFTEELPYTLTDND